MRRMRWLMLAFLAAMALMAYVRPSPDVRATPPVTRTAPAPSPAPTVESPDADAALPPEADATLALIAAGGPYPFARDGVVFGNYEHRLPHRERGWYREYTVPTPGVEHRGARRIVTGGDPPAEYWYTDDHYESFRKIEGARGP